MPCTNLNEDPHENEQSLREKILTVPIIRQKAEELRACFIGNGLKKEISRKDMRGVSSKGINLSIQTAIFEKHHV